MKKMLCPQCKIAAMYVKNESGERRLVYVTEQAEVVPKNPEETLERDVGRFRRFGGLLSGMFLARFSQEIGQILKWGR